MTPEPRDAITQGTLRTTTGTLLPLEQTDVDARVAGPIADVTVRQRFRNTSAEPIEAVYLFPLPAEASVHRMQFRIDDRVVRAVVKEKGEARKAYEQAKSEGRAATLLEEDTPALFQLSVANVAPGAVIDVELEYQEVLAYDDGEWRFVFPIVAPERYREAPAPASSSLASPRLPSGERAADVSLRVTLRDPLRKEALRCASHATTLTELDDGALVVRLREGAPVANRDFVLAWPAALSGVRPIVRFERRAGDDGAFLLVVTPSSPESVTRVGGGGGETASIRCGNCGGLVKDLAAIKEVPGLGPIVPCAFCGAMLAPGTALVTRASRPRDVVVLVDRSASMRGALPQARRAVVALLRGLAAGDALQVVAFDHDRLAFDGDGSRWVGNAPEVVARVDAFLAKLGARGGSAVEAALEHVAKLPVRDGRTRVVVLVTDAAVGNEGRLLRRVPELLGAVTRLFVLGAGPAVDRRLVARLARAGGGAHDVLAPDEGVEKTIDRFARRVREGGPVLTGLALSWEGADVRDVHPAAIPDLYGGQPVRLLGRFAGKGASRLVLTAVTPDGKPFRQELSVDLPEESRDAPGLARLWARDHVEALASRAAEDARSAPALRAEATALALEHALVGPFTSLVAEDSEVAVKPTGSTRVERKAKADAPLAPTYGGAPEAEAAIAFATLGAVDELDDLRAAPLPAAPPPGAVACAPPACAAPRRAAKIGAADSFVTRAARTLAAPLRAMLAEDAAPPPQQAKSRQPPPLPIDVPGSDTYPEDELRWLEGRLQGELDLVFLVDATASMAPYIDAVRARLLELIAAVRASPLCRSLRLGIVTYRDHPPQDPTYVTKVLPLTDDVERVRAEVLAMSAQGGGDGPEAVTDGLFEVVRLDWRASAARAVVWFGDAPPHGVEHGGDGFPGGCPCGHHWYAQAESCGEMGVAIYAIGCLPALRQYAGAEGVFRAVARATRGTYLPLREANLLVPMIAGAAATELDRQRIDAHVAELARAHEAELAATDEEERVRWLTGALREARVRPREMEGDEETSAPSPLRFRDAEPGDVRGALGRLRVASRIGV